MHDTLRVQFLRGERAASADVHPIIELSDDELRLVIGGIDMAMGSTNNQTSSYNTSAPATCCDGTKVCCCINEE